MRTFLAVAALLLVSSVAGADELKRGEIVDGIACAADPTVTYAYYLPTHYTKDQRWPIVFVFDPRKRGALAAGFFRDAAERYGWIIVSSNNTESDTDPRPSVHAIELTLPDAQKRFAVDTNRIYLAGFSGTAMIGWAVSEVTTSVAGLIGCSGRPLPKPTYRVSFAWFGTAGNYDFNYVETKTLDRGLAAAGGTHRVEFFEGRHRWAPPELLMQGVQWMELLAMRAGTRPRDEAMIKERYDADLATARADKDPLDAVRHLESIVRTFEGLTAVDEPKKMAAELRASKAFAKAERDERRAEEFEMTSRGKVARVMSDFMMSNDVPFAPALAHDLDIQNLQRMASKHTYEGDAAQRVLEGIYAQTNFYDARESTGAKLVVLKAVSAMIHPENKRP